MIASFAITLAVRYLLVALFLPFSALDKILNFNGAVSQCQEQVSPRTLAKLFILAALCVEILMPLCILTGYVDRLAAFIMAGYCGTTALLWKQFWTPGDFWQKGQSRGRDLFWDFLKNFALAGGFLLITFGPNAGAVGDFFAHPLSSTHPYTIATEAPQP
jgi:putative oxidoreductase